MHHDSKRPPFSLQFQQNTELNHNVRFEYIQVGFVSNARFLHTVICFPNACTTNNCYS